MRLSSRRQFIGGGAAAAALTLGPTAALAPAATQGRARAASYGDLVEDPAGLLDLPRGFRYRLLSIEGDELTSGATSPAITTAWLRFPARTGRPCSSETTSCAAPPPKKVLKGMRSRLSIDRA